MGICDGQHNHANAHGFHPAIDRVRLDELYANSVSGLRDVWSTARKQRLSKFNLQDMKMSLPQSNQQ